MNISPRTLVKEKGGFHLSYRILKYRKDVNERERKKADDRHCNAKTEVRLQYTPVAECGDFCSHSDVRLTSDFSEIRNTESLRTQLRSLNETLILLRWRFPAFSCKTFDSLLYLHAEWLVRVMDILRDLCSAKRGCIVCRFGRGSTLRPLLQPFSSQLLPSWIISCSKSLFWFSNYFNFKLSLSFAGSS